MEIRHRRVPAAVRVVPGSPLDRVARALYEHDARASAASAPWLAWEHAVAPKRLRYLARARAALRSMGLGED